MRTRDINTVAAEWGREYAKQIAPFVAGSIDPSAPLREVPDADQVALRREFPDATDEEFNAACAVYVRAVNRVLF